MDTAHCRAARTGAERRQPGHEWTRRIVNNIIIMENSERFFSNTACPYFPCHEWNEGEPFNCLFCYCPLNHLKVCPGSPRWIERKDGQRIKDCSGCSFPHRPENYDVVIEWLKKG